MGVRTTSRNAAPNNGPTPWYDGHLDKFYNTEFNEGDTGTNYTPPPEYQGHTASGGVIHDYVDSGVAYRCHIFGTDATFSVTTLSTAYPAAVDYLLIGGGGGGGNDTGPGWSGGGGAGDVRATVGTNGGGQSLDAQYTISADTDYAIQIGGGGGTANYNQSDTTMGGIHTPGGNSSIFGLTAYGGGRGGNNQQDGAQHASGGGSGGGAGYNAEGAGSGTYGYPGGSPGSNAPAGSGGGGAGQMGGNNPSYGGRGVQATIVGPSALARGIVGTPNTTPHAPTPSHGWVGGGGSTDGPTNGGVGGGGNYSNSQDSNPTFGNITLGVHGTGGGGGGAGSGWSGGQGGSGLCVVRYQIGTTLANSAKATGGAVSFYDAPNGNTYCNHIFLHPGIFTNESGSPLAIDHVIIGGGGGGGFQRGGGGGAGGIRTNIPGMMPAADAQQTVGAGGPNAVTVTVGYGGKGGCASPMLIQAWGGDDSGISGPGPINLWAAGGGWGSSDTPTTGAQSGGSGGGGRAQNNHPGKAGNVFNPYSPRNPGTAANQGNAGGDAPGGSPHYGGGGGGGAGGAGQNGSNGAGGAGGEGKQLPLQFRNPEAVFGGIGPGPGSAPGPGPGQFWVGGGGGGGYYDSPGSPWVGGPGGGGGPNSGKHGYSGGGPASPAVTYPGGRGQPGTGGGGGAGLSSPTQEDGGMGGPGIVLISYTV